jgi:hypothetical protein
VLAALPWRGVPRARPGGKRLLGRLRILAQHGAPAIDAIDASSRGNSKCASTFEISRGTSARNASKSIASMRAPAASCAAAQRLAFHQPSECGQLTGRERVKRRERQLVAGQQAPHAARAVAA